MTSLESCSFPGQHVGIQDNGCVKAPGTCGRGPHASFTVELVEAAGASYVGPGAHQQVSPAISSYIVHGRSHSTAVAVAMVHL